MTFAINLLRRSKAAFRRKPLVSLVLILCGLVFGYHSIFGLLEVIQYHREGQTATARVVTYHSSGTLGLFYDFYDVVYEREREQVHARMYELRFCSPEAGDEILYLPDRPDKVKLKSFWCRFLQFVGGLFWGVCGIVLLLEGLGFISVDGGGGSDRNTPGAGSPPVGKDEEPVNARDSRA